MTSLSELRQRLLHPYYILHLVYGGYYVIARSNQLIRSQSINFEAGLSKSRTKKKQKKTKGL